MGFLNVFGLVILFDESKKYFKIIKDNFVEYVIREFKKKYICKEPMFGFEFEFHKINIDTSNKKILLDLSAQKDIITSITQKKSDKFYLAHEYGGWMYEVIPRQPLKLDQLHLVDKCIQELYQYITNTYGKNKFLSLGSYPHLGVGDYFMNEFIDEIDKNEEERIKVAKNKYLDDINNNNLSKSNYLSDRIINKHPRFGNLTRNIRTRRGEKVEIKIPIYKDINTNINSVTEDEPFPGYVNMDAMGFGMGCCSLQVTIGCDNLENCQQIYDQLIPLSPLFLVISSSTPIHKGKLVDLDDRWIIISKSVDDRTKEERDPKSDKYIYKSRYSPIYSYIGNVDQYYNDYPKFPINQDYYKKFIESGMSQNLATHFCNLLVRDPLVIFDEKIELKDENDMTHFENINSSNWNSIRFKLPRPSDHDLSYKIEVRTCDIQITPFENASIVHLVMNLFKIISKKKCNFIIPMTKVDENFENSYQRDAINNKKFWWRVNCFDPKFVNYNYEKSDFNYEKDDKENIKLLTINEIFNGVKEYNYPGLLNMIKEEIYQDYKVIEIQKKLLQFVNFLERRTKGELFTDAKYIRKFVNEHPKYKKDSIITEEINYDLIMHILQIQNGLLKPKELFGE